MNRKNLILIYLFTAVCFTIILFNGCKKDKIFPPNLTITTNIVSDITNTSAVSGGVITTHDSIQIISRGVCWSINKPVKGEQTDTSSSITLISNDVGLFSIPITGLNQGTLYYISAFVTYIDYTTPTDTIVIAYAKYQSFKTTEEEVRTTPITSRSINSATCGGKVTSKFSSSIIARGICWSRDSIHILNESKTIDGTGLGTFTSEMKGLGPNTTYYASAYALSASDTSFGNIIIVKTYGNTIEDVEGNIYNTISIGSQIWMAENLRTTKLNDGTLLTLAEKNPTWNSLNIPGYCWYNNDNKKYNSDYGALYNWEAVNTGKLCPVGWHVPYDTEWKKLSSISNSGNKLREAGLDHWLSPNANATNETGFTGLPGGGRNYVGMFDDITQYGYWWSSTRSSSERAKFWYLYYDESKFTEDSLEIRSGISVRCLMD
jgi:uncharacterized protein (TIGR02145 family)